MFFDLIMKTDTEKKFKIQFRFKTKIECPFLPTDSFPIRVLNVHSNYNQLLLKIELKIANFQFSFYFSIFNFQFLTYIA